MDWAGGNVSTENQAQAATLRSRAVPRSLQRRSSIWGSLPIRPIRCGLLESEPTSTKPGEMDLPEKHYMLTKSRKANTIKEGNKLAPKKIMLLQQTEYSTVSLLDILLRCVWNGEISVQLSCSATSNSLHPHGLQHARPPVHHQFPESTQTHVHWVSDAIQPSHPLSSLSPPALNLSQYQGLFKWVSSSYQVAKGLEFQLQHQSFQWTPRTDPKGLNIL